MGSYIRALDEESVKPCIQDRLKALLSSFTFLSFSIITVIVVIFAFVEPYKLHWDSFYPALIATFLGVFLGFTLDRMFSLAQEKGTINRIIISILNELEMNLKDLEEWNFVITQTYFTRSQNSIFESAIGGGYLSLMDVETQKKLSRLYSNINFITYKSDRILMIGVEMKKEDPNMLIKANEKLQDEVNASIKEHHEVIKYLRARVSLKP